MKTGFITFEDFHGKKDIGSSRIRARWLVEKWNDPSTQDIGDAELHKFGGKYDAVIYQKAYWHQHAEKFSGVKILDMCDPDFLDWGYPIKRTMEACDAITCSTDALAETVADFAGKPVYVIPDCILNPHTLKKKRHVGSLRSVLWYGYPENFEMLDSALQAVIKRDLELIVVSSKAYRPTAVVHKERLKLTNIPWTQDRWMDDLLKADVILNPRSTNGRFRFKSDNKTIQAWALGIPVAHTDEELDKFIDADARQQEGDLRRKWVEDERDAVVAVKLMKEVISDVLSKK